MFLLSCDKPIDPFDETRTDTVIWRPTIKHLVPRMDIGDFLFDSYFAFLFVSSFSYFHFLFVSSFFLPLPKGYLGEAIGFHSPSGQEQWMVTQSWCTLEHEHRNWHGSKARQTTGEKRSRAVCVSLDFFFSFLSLYLISIFPSGITIRHLISGQHRTYVHNRLEAGKSSCCCISYYDYH